MIIKALIPVRSGSIRVKNKNIKPFIGTSLLELKIKQMLRIQRINEVIVNSNCDEMLSIAESLGATPVKRDEYYASNTVSMNEVYENMAQNCLSDVIVFADATNPLIKDSTICEALDMFLNKDPDLDSLTTVSEVKQFLWQNKKPLNYDINNKPRSQDLPDIFALNHAISILGRDLMIKKRDIVGFNPYLFKIDSMEGLDIDTEIDFEIAEFLYKKYRQKGDQI
jgi:CMP-N-acetylneuraminic acid synthetase